MQPLARPLQRLFFDSIPSSGTPRLLRRSIRPSIQSSVCRQCDLPAQRRQFADTSKQTSTSSPSTTGQAEDPTELSNSSAEQSSRTEQFENVPSDALPSTADSRRSALNHRFSHLMDHLQGNIFIASQRLNDLTGYSGIETLKSKIQGLEDAVQSSQELVRSTRTHYKSVVASRAATQREVTTLLARKDSWTPIDLERFTSLYRMDHSNEQAVQEAATKLAEAEREAEVVAGQLSAAILGRYHEEQIWSDKIRRMSTWGTWGLMGVNVLLFFVFQFALEPWRRKRLVGGFEEKVLEALERERDKQRSTGQDAEDEVSVGKVQAERLLEEKESANRTESVPIQEAILAVAEDTTAAATTASTGTGEGKEDSTPNLDIRDPATWRPNLEDLFSTRLIQIRKQDVTTIALEGAATGAALTAIIATFIFRST